MKKLGSIAVTLLSVLSLLACSQQARQSSGTDPVEVDLQSADARLSYAAAYDFQTQIEASELPLVMEAFLLGLKDAYGDAKPRISEAAMNAEVQIFMAELQYKRELALRQERMRLYGSEEGSAAPSQLEFLSDHMRKIGVVTVQRNAVRNSEGGVWLQAIKR